MDILNIENLSKEEKNLKLIDNINLVVESGKCIGIKCPEEIGMLLFNMILNVTRPSKGNIYINGTLANEKKIKANDIIAVVLKDEGMYDRLTVKEYLNFFRGIYNCSDTKVDILGRLGLMDIQNNKIKTLTYSQKRRLSIARALLSNAKIILIQEPTLSLDIESVSIIREAIPYICSLGISIIAVSIALEDIILLGGTSYVLDEKGLNPIELDTKNDEDIKQIDNEIENKEIKVNKIPAKINEKIILFNPTEIVYIESLDGTSYININGGGEKFPCNLTLSELENRLKYFGFFRCHRSYLVNLQRVREIITWTRSSYSLILDDKDKSSIPLSKGKLDELKGILSL